MKNRGTTNTSSPVNLAQSLSLIRQESRLVITANPHQIILEDKPEKTHDHGHDSDYSLVIPYRPFNTKDEVQIVLERSGDLMLADGKVHERPVFAILGILPLMTANYIVAVTDRQRVGSIFGKHDVFVIKRADVIPISSDAWAQSQPDSQRREEQQYVNFITAFLSSGSFFFSYTYDLSNTMERHQKLQTSAPNIEERNSVAGISAVWNYIDSRFVWNQHLVEPLLPFSKSFGNWFPPVIQGFVHVSNDCSLDVHEKGSVVRKNFSFALISRRNKNRAGTRYHTRGADKEGNVAAFVETEQILGLPNPQSGAIVFTSFIQTRGSIPLFWKQDVNLAYEPPIVIDHNDDSPLRKHMSEQINFYNKNVIINLVKKKGAEGPLGMAYKKVVRGWNNEKVRYVGFDVYQHCKNSDYDKLSRLVTKVEKDMTEMGYFATDGKSVLKSQTGVFRTNCKDCLDRTNLVQGLFARLNLIHQLKEYGLIKSEDDLKNTKFYSSYRHVWADNGDTISITYAGTPALKGDVTRTGKRSFQGMIDDGFNAVARYYINNFQDGVKQDAMDLFLGNCTPHQRSTSSLSREEKLAIFAWVVTIFNIIAPLQMRYKYHQIFIVTFILLFVIFVAKIFKMGKKVVNTPRLPKAIKQKTG